jgi:hypothetical protein
MKKLFVMFFMLLVVVFSTVKGTYAYDTGPPGVETLVNYDSEEFDVLNSEVFYDIDYSQRGVIVLGPGDLFRISYDILAFVNSAKNYTFISNNTYVTMLKAATIPQIRILNIDPGRVYLS